MLNASQPRLRDIAPTAPDAPRRVLDPWVSRRRSPQVYDISGADFENLSILGKKTQRAVGGKPFGCPFNLFTADQFDPDRFPNGVARHSIRGGDVSWPVGARVIVQAVQFSQQRGQESAPVDR